MALVYLGLGTNLGNRLENLYHAIQAMGACCQILAVSKLYETAPVGITNQPAFYNIAVKALTQLAPHDLLTTLKTMEKTLGRVENVRWGPRQIDIDILLYDQRQIHDSALDIPHPRLSERRFVLVPLADIGNDAVHPESSQTIAQLLSHLPDDNDIVDLGDLFAAQNQ